jgi:hypothetical protein
MTSIDRGEGKGHDAERERDGASWEREIGKEK